MVAANGSDHAGNHLQRLLGSSLGVGGRYEESMGSVKCFGLGGVTGIMNCTEPTSCGIRNKQAREALRILGFGSSVNLNRHRVTGAEYGKFKSLSEATPAELARAALQNVDLAMVDFFLCTPVQSPSGLAAVLEVASNREEA